MPRDYFAVIWLEFRLKGSRLLLFEVISTRLRDVLSDNDHMNDQNDLAMVIILKFITHCSDDVALEKCHCLCETWMTE